MQGHRRGRRPRSALPSPLWLLRGLRPPRDNEVPPLEGHADVRHWRLSLLGTFWFTGLQNTVGQSKTLQKLAVGGGNLVGPLVHLSGGVERNPLGPL